MTTQFLRRMFRRLWLRHGWSEPWMPSRGAAELP
jgi:hypothetical protein